MRLILPIAYWGTNANLVNVLCVYTFSFVDAIQIFICFHFPLLSDFILQVNLFFHVATSKR